MLYQDRIVDLIDRRYNLVVESPDEDFWLEIDRFMRFIQEEETLKSFTNKMIRDEEDWVSIYEDKLKEEVADIEQIRQEFIAKYPNLDDNNVTKPTPNENIVELYNKDPYFKSFAWFNELVERVRSNGPTIWSRTISPNVPDPTEAARLISLLEGKISDIPKVNFPEDIYLRLKYLREKHNHLRQKFKNECKVLPFASLAYLNELTSYINPEPRRYKSISQWSSESVHQSIEQIIQPPIRDRKVSQFHLRRVYEQLRSDIGSQLAHYELIQRYKIRCMFYDRKRIEELIQATKRYKEDALTRDLALYLFDNGISSLYRVKRGIHEYDLIASSLFVEAKVYSKSNKKRLIDGISQLHSYINGLEADAKNIREIYYVIFRLDGPLYDWPEKIEMNRWTIYPVTIDLGPSIVSGSRQPRTVKITVDEIYATLPTTDEQSPQSGMHPMRVGILAYGSLIDDSGEEILPLIIDRISVETPFAVEFARSSRTRRGAPTLVPVKVGGAKVNATVLVLEEYVTISQATNILYRRETNSVSNFDVTYDPKSSGEDATQIVSLTGKDAFGLSVVLYTHLNSNIEPLTPDQLGELAIQSARTEAGKNKRDGISYLINAIENEIQTPLTLDYMQAILVKTETSSLMEAWNKLTQQ